VFYLGRNQTGRIWNSW